MAFHCIRCKAEIDKAFKACPHCGEPVTDFLRRYADEPVDGKYDLVERLGAGGMGDVYKATHRMLGVTRVIKVIRPQISDSKDAHDRFLREARAATKIQDANVATLHDFAALPDGSHYMVWEYIDGENLAQRIRARGTLQPRYAAGIAIQALNGLDAIHRAGIVHRDISPENIMITRESGAYERVKIIDLGVAKIEEPNDNATRAGVFVGKLRYASPEHLGFLNDNERIDGRADLYSLAMVLYEMLTGRPPFEASTPHQYIMLHSRQTQFRPLDLPPDLPGGQQLAAIVAKGLERDRDNRFASARDFAAALVDVQRSLPDPKSIPTMNAPTPDLDATFHQTPLPAVPPSSTRSDTLHRDTLRSGFGADPTIRTPLPGHDPVPPAGLTQRTPFPPQQAAPPTEFTSQNQSSTKALLVVGLIVLLAAGAIGSVLYLRSSKTPDQPPAKIAGTETTPPVTGSAAATTAQSNVDVVTTTPIASDTSTTSNVASTANVPSTATSTAPVLTAPSSQPPLVIPPANTVPVLPKPKPSTPPIVTPKEPESKPKEPSGRPTPVPSNVRTFIDGSSGDSDVNEEILEQLQRSLHNVQRVTIKGSGAGDQQKELAGRLSREFPAMTIADGADTVITFDANLEHLGRGKKRRSAIATITRDGHVVFRYELPSEEFRIGDSPAEAFERVLAEAFGH